LAVLEKLGVSYLATNDDDFDSIAGVTVYKPARTEPLQCFEKCDQRLLVFR
jgi:hypothetical protein